MCSICFANSAAASLLILVRLRGGKRMERRHSNMNLTSPTVLDQAYLNLRRGFDRVPLIEAKLADLSAAAKALTNSGRSLKRSTAHIRHVANISGTPCGPCWNTSKQEDRSPGVEPISEILAGGWVSPLFTVGITTGFLIG